MKQLLLIVKNLILAAGFLCCTKNSFAIDDPELVQFKTGATEINPSALPLELSDIKFYNPSTFATIDNPANDQITNVVSLLVNEDMLSFIQTDFTATVTAKIEFTKKDGSLGEIASHQFVITFNKATGLKYDQRQTLKFKDCRKVKVTVLSILPSVSSWDIWTVIRLESRMLIKRDYIFNPLLYLTLPHLPVLVPDADELPLDWSASPNITAPGVTHYDLEWTWADKEAETRYQKLQNPSDPGSMAFFDDLLFRNNSTRITISGDSLQYKIPLIYDGEGKLFYRIRRVQYREDGQVINGDWSTSGFSNITYLVRNIGEGHQENLNWQTTTSYAEDGKRKTIVQYFDGTLRGRQTVTKDNSTNKTVVAETFYDYQGRPAVQILPAPTMNSVIKFTENFNRFVGGVVDPKDAFDLVPAGLNNCSMATPKLDDDFGTAQYYSPKNPLANKEFNRYIPDAKGYVYTETLYTDDATGRIIAQSGVGEKHQLNSGHETKYFYGKPDQKELDALFGTEAGDATHYSKNMVRDANGQYSVSYVDMHGRTIATALAGKSPENLAPLASNNYDQDKSMVKDLLTPANNLVQGRSIVSTTTLLVTKQGLHKFKYALHPGSPEIIACLPPGDTICYDCYYDLEIRINARCNNATTTGFPIVKTATNLSFNANGSPNLDSSCANPSPSIIYDFNEVLPEGEYDITKILTVSKRAQDYYRDTTFKYHNICKILENFIQDNYTILSQTDCELTCAECNLALGTEAQYRINFLTSQGLDPNVMAPYENEIHASWLQAKENCDELCNNGKDVLGAIRELMLKDMSPDQGQYVRQDEDLNENGTIDNFYDANNTQRWETYTDKIYNIYPAFKYRFPKDSVGNPSFYKDEFGSKDIDIYPLTVPDTLNRVSPDVFAAMFKDSWAEELLYYHPEYCKLKYAEDNLKPSFTKDGLVEETDTYAAAVAAGYITPDGLGILNTDPFFNGVGIGYKNLMQQYIAVKYNRLQPPMPGYDPALYPASLWQLAYSSVICVKNENAFCVLHAPKTPAGFSVIPGGCTGDRDMIWQIFKFLYLAEKDRMVNEFLNGVCPMSAADLAAFNLAKYERRFGKPEEYYQGSFLETIIAQASGNNASGASASVNAELDAQYADNCESYKIRWEAQLRSCPQIANHPQAATIIQQINEGLKTVCINGSDADHPWGSSTVKPGTPLGIPPSFEAVILPIFIQFGINKDELCHEYMIDFPKPYDKQPALSDGIVLEKKDDCICSRLTELRNKWGGPKGCSFSDYIFYNHGIRIRQTLLDSLLTACGSSINYPNLLAYFPMNEGSGTILRDFTGNGLDKNLANATPNNTGWVAAGSINSSYDGHPPGSGVPPAINLGSSFMQKAALEKSENNFVIELFVKPTSTHQIDAESYTGFAGISGQKYAIEPTSLTPSGSSYIYSSIGISVGTNGVSVYEHAPGHMPALLVWQGTIADWTHVRVVVENKQPKLYINGVWVKDGLVSIKDKVFPSISFPSSAYPNMDGAIDDVRVWAGTTGIPDFNAQQSTSLGIQDPGATCKLWDSPLEIPAILHCDVPLKNCIDCIEYDSLKTIFYSAFPSNSLMQGALYGSPQNEMEQHANEAFARFMNFHTGFNKTWYEYYSFQNNCAATFATSDTVSQAAGYCYPIYQLCGQEPLFQTVTEDQKDPCDYNNTLALNKGTEQYNAYLENQYNFFDSTYLAKCLEAKNFETFTVEAPVAEYHYTLYYYDLAGNLLKTVPPKGVVADFSLTWLAQVKAARLADADLPNDQHTLTTNYRYNTLNQVIAQNSPDAGSSNFWYDVLGRLVISQNAKQQLHDQFSYTIYDLLGRINEVGQKDKPGGSMSQLTSQNPTALKNWLIPSVSQPRKQITRTVYDEAYTDFCISSNIFCQQNLRNRVSYSYVQAVDDGSSPVAAPWESGIFYTYDLHGNVDILLQDFNKGMGEFAGTNANRFKKVFYQYDLISGKVNSVAYQPGKADAFYHQYNYDAENKLTIVKTSKDEVYWETEADYTYYRHGPLARTKIGQLNVQGVDYAYTLQGWLKGVNSTGLRVQKQLGTGNDCGPGTGVDYLIVPQRLTPYQNLYTARKGIEFIPKFSSLSPTDNFVAEINPNLGPCIPGTDTAGQGRYTDNYSVYDMGEDGKMINNSFSTKTIDAYGFALNYFDNDYQAVNAGVTPFATITAPVPVSGQPLPGGMQLFNGNISSMAVQIPKLGDANLYRYTYDQLNRIVAMDAFTGLTQNNTWNNPQATNNYKERVSYDANGNILSYLRNGTGTPVPGQIGGLNMDDLAYDYIPNSNKLKRVTDNPLYGNNYKEDIDTQTDPNNYVYDAIGNLIEDKAEGITNIEWNVYGKITRITKTKDGYTRNIDYTYDASGNRISKTSDVLQNADDVKTTFYVRDASGNVMSIYENGEGKAGQGQLFQKELDIYGSGRLGVYNVKTEVTTDTRIYVNSTSGALLQAEKTIFTRGYKHYELSNHLGNVLVTITDKKIGVDNGTYHLICPPCAPPQPGEPANCDPCIYVETNPALDGIIDFFTPDIVTANDYYPFGMVMPGRNFTNGDQYRYGFNGKEKDDEVKGEGNQQDYGLRIYDTRLSKFLSVDPLTASYPWYSPYQFAGNNPIKFIDLDGGEPKDPGKYDGQGAIAPQIVDGKTCADTDNDKWIWNNSQWNFTAFNVTNSELTSIFPKGKTESLKQIEISVNLTGSTFGIKSKKSLAHFLSQAGAEVGGFSKGFDIEESLNYSVDGLIGTFGDYFYNGTPVKGKLDANLYGRIVTKVGKVTKVIQAANQEAIGNQAYGSRMGNGDFASGDGYKYRGRGMFQLTGKSNYSAFNKFLNQAGVDIVAKPELILTTEYAIKSAMWFYKTAVVDKLKIESTTVKQVTKKVNGGDNGLTERQTTYDKAIENLK